MTVSEFRRDINPIKYRTFIEQNKLKKENQIYPYGGGPQDDLLYGFLCLVYDGINDINSLKKKMKILYTSTMRQSIILDNDIEELIQTAIQKKYLNLTNQTLSLTNEGRKFVESATVLITHQSYWMKIGLSEISVMILSAIFLLFLTTLKIFVGRQLGSQAMITDGFENLTDLIKIGIILILGIKMKKDKIASIIIIIMMMVTGVSLIWSSIEAIMNPIEITPSFQAYFIMFISLIMNSGLFFLKGLVGKTSGNLALIGDAKDSKLNLYISGSVIIGLTFSIFGIFFIDAIIGIIISILLIKDGIEFLHELISKKDQFNITEVKVFADNIYKNRLTGYLLGKTIYEKNTREELINKFKDGLYIGRQYYLGFADFFYNRLEDDVVKNYLDKLIENESIFVEEDGILLITDKGEKIYKRIKSLDRKTHQKHLSTGKTKNFYRNTCGVLCLIFIISCVIFGPFLIDQINMFLGSFGNP